MGAWASPGLVEYMSCSETDGADGIDEDEPLVAGIEHPTKIGVELV